MPSSACDWSSDVCSSDRSEEHTSELQSRSDLVCRLLLEKKKAHVRTHSTTISGIATGACTRAATVGEVVDRLRVPELPVNCRHVMQLAKLIPGVSQVSAP